MTWNVIGRMYGDFGELAVECELLDDTTGKTYCFAENVHGPRHYFLNGLEITEQEVRRIIETTRQHSDA